MDEPQHKKKKNDRGDRGEKAREIEILLAGHWGDPQKDGRRKMYQLKMQLRFQ